MKKLHVFIVLGVMLLLIPVTSWASDRVVDSQDTPAILASLDQKNVTPLDDKAIAEIRGQAQYQMVRIFPLNFLDYSYDVSFTSNPLLWRYGNWGGANYTANGDPVDAMDALFEDHDSTNDNAALLTGLQSLPKTFTYQYRWWGWIYQPTSYDSSGNTPLDDGHFGYSVYVSRISVLSAGGKFFWGWKPMPLTEYARRQAVIAMTVLSIVLP